MIRLLLACCLLTAASTFAANLDSEHFLNTDIFELEVATDPQISPDGERIAYVRKSMDIMSDKQMSNVWLVDIGGRQHRPMLSGVGGFSSPRWSPNGDRIAYLTKAGKRGSQLHLRWMDTGQTALLSNLRSTPKAIAWSPDGKQIAFMMFVKSQIEPLAKAPKMPKGAKWAPPARVIETLKYRADGQGYLEPGFTHVFVLPADGGTPRQLTSGNFEHLGPLSWSPDSKTLVVSTNRNKDWQHQPLESELWSIQVASGEMQQLTDRAGPDRAPSWSPDGSKIAYIGFDDKKMGYHNRVAYVMDTRNFSSRAVTLELDRSIDSVQWAGNSDRLYVTYDDQGKRVLATTTLRGKLQVLADDVGGVSLGRPYTSGDFSVAKSGAYAYTAGAPTRPADIAAARRGKKPVQLTSLNDDLMGRKTMANIKPMNWQSPIDDYQLQGWIATPPNFDPSKKYPLILEIHGGPFAAYGPQFSAEVQLFAAAGYVVLYMNPRGSTSYGDAFANEIHHNYPGQDYDDLMSGVDEVIAKGFIDTNQLFVTGGSGGGVLTAWIVGKTNRFAAAVVAKPVINWTSTVLTTDIATFMPQYWFAKPPWEDQKSYWARSPLSLVGNVATPTMLLTGEVDHRTPIPESEQYYQALKLRKIDTAMVRIPEASHGIAKRPSHLIAKVDNILAWFERYHTTQD